MNIVDFLFKIILGAMGPGSAVSSAAEISNHIFDQLKKVLKSLIVLFICSVIFCLLMGYLIDRVLTQIDSDVFVFTNSIIFLLVLIIVNLIAMAWALKKASRKDEPVLKEVEKKLSSEVSPLETAVAALILSFIKDRESKKTEGPNL